MVLIEAKLVEFLARQGLSITQNKGNVQVFRPGSQVDYLGFSFVYPDYKNRAAINRGKFTRRRYGVSELGNYRTSPYHRANPYVRISDKSFSKMKLNLIKLFDRSLAAVELKGIIQKVNSFIRGICNYFAISSAASKQLSYIDEVLYRRTKKILMKKFKSKPKTGTYIAESVMVNGRVTIKETRLLKVSEIKPYGGMNIA